MLKVAILGANGFIGSRAVEILHLAGMAEVRPIVRQPSSLARLARFDLDFRLANALDQKELSSAFAGCNIVINLALGNCQTIIDSIEPIYLAANEARVERLIHLSSAVVHGQRPKFGTTEETPISTVQPLPYNRAKVKAERRLKMVRKHGSTEIIILRPGIVFGPRSRWTAGIADELLRGTAYFLNDGKGICNSIYIDNLIEAIYLSMSVSNADGEAFFLNDNESITWADFYGPIALALGLDQNQIAHITGPTFSQNIKDMAMEIRASKPIQHLLPLIPYSLKRSAKAALTALADPEPKSPWSCEKKPRITPSLEMVALQQCNYKLPSDKAIRMLGFSPKITFQEGCKRSIRWLKFAGYPVVHDE